MKTIMSSHISLPLATVGAIIIAFSAALASYYGTVNSQVQATADIKQNVAVLQASQVSQDAEITAITQNLSVMNNNIVKLLVHAGVQPTTPSNIQSLQTN